MKLLTHVGTITTDTPHAPYLHIRVGVRSCVDLL